jgi:hypothetical protein
LQIKTKIVSSHAADSNPVKQEVNGTVILPPLVFPGATHVELTLLHCQQNIWCGVLLLRFWFEQTQKRKESNEILRSFPPTLFDPSGLIYKALSIL